MKKHLLLLLFVAALLVAACNVQASPAPAAPTATPVAAATVPAAPADDATPEPAAEAAPAEAGVLPREALRNATYSGIYDQPITLTDGLYEGKPEGEGDLSRPTVEYVDDTDLTGDLDGDGVDDAVVFLLERGGGSGAFTYVAAQLNRDGQPADAGAVRIEDRIGVRSATIEAGQVVLDLILQGPGDVACCGSHKARKTYALQESRLVETTAAGGELVKVSAADLDGTKWTLLELGDDQPAYADADVTLTFQDGQIAGSGGCSNYVSSFSLDEVNPFVMAIGPVAATQQACPDPVGSQETAYFAALEGAGHWAYAYGRLALFYADGRGGMGRLLFAPQAAPDAAAVGPEPETAPPPSEDLTMLRAHPWQWVSFTNPLETVEIENPAGYRVAFNPDASLAITADCNDVVGFYQGEWGEALTIVVDPAALVECGPESRSAQFVKLLAAGTRYFFEGDTLYIDLFADGGTLVFAPADEMPMAETDGYTAASSLTRNGFAKDGEQMGALRGQVAKLWVYVDHGNLYGDERAKAILGDWWSGAGPDTSTWRFNLKANVGDATGESFAVNVANDAGRDDLLQALVADAQAGRPTKVFVTGRLFTFDAPSSDGVRTGLMLKVQSSSDVLLQAPSDPR